MYHHNVEPFALETAQFIDEMIYEKTGYYTGMGDPESDYWQIRVSPTRAYQIYGDILSPDLRVERAYAEEGRYVRYDNVVDGFKDIQKDAEPLGFTVERISPFGLVFRELDGPQRTFNVYVEYEKNSYRDSPSYIPSFTFARSLDKTNDTFKRDCSREGRTVARKTDLRRSSSGPRTKTFITNQATVRT